MTQLTDNKASLVDFLRQRWPKRTQRSEKRDWIWSLVLLPVGISKLFLLDNFHLTTTLCVSVFSCFYLGGIWEGTTGRKLRGFACNARLQWKCLSGSCHLPFNHFPILCVGTFINIMKPLRWGKLGMQLILIQGYCFFRELWQDAVKLVNCIPSYISQKHHALTSAALPSFH